jgi:hypothetical protein
VHAASGEQLLEQLPSALLTASEVPVAHGEVLQDAVVPWHRREQVQSYTCPLISTQPQLLNTSESTPNRPSQNGFISAS